MQGLSGNAALASAVQKAIAEQGGVKEKTEQNGRKRMFDFASEDVKKDDAEYSKLLRTIEEGHGARKAHYIHARGAMDQGDAGWMNELQERRAHGEIATMERERRLFQKLRQHAAVGSTSQEESAPGDLFGEKKQRKRAAIKVVRKAGGDATSSAPSGGETEGSAGGEEGGIKEGRGSGQAEGRGGSGGEEVGGGGDSPGGSADREGGRERKRARGADGGEGDVEKGREGGGEGEENVGGGLGGLLGQYGSEDESE